MFARTVAQKREGEFMHAILRISAIVAIFIFTSISWLILGGINHERTQDQNNDLRGKVTELWGAPQQQVAPTLTFVWTEQHEEVRTEEVDGVLTKVSQEVVKTKTLEQSPDATKIEVDLALDQRLKGLMWYPLYDVDFEGQWTYSHREEKAGELRLGFAFPDPQGLYDGFRFVVDGMDRARDLRPENGRVEMMIPVEPGQTVELGIAYKSRGMTQWTYVPAHGVSNLEDFALSMHTDFEDIDFPAYTMSPSVKDRTEEGWKLQWVFERVVTGHNIGMVMPERIQPGELAARMSFSAPISLAFFFLILFVLGTLRRIDIHPINYVLLAGAFFAFHLLFSYAVNHIEIVPAFLLASIVSVTLVVSYLRLVVSARFALVEAAAAQAVYLIGFSLAHFFDGFTGLTVTVLSILTLFLVMQLTGRIQWSEALKRTGSA